MACFVAYLNINERRWNDDACYQYVIITC